MADKPRYHPDAFRLDPKSVAVGMIIRNAIGCQLKVLELICNKTRVIYRVVQTPEDERNFLNKEGQVEVVEFAERAVAVMKEPQVLNAVPNRSSTTITEVIMPDVTIEERWDQFFAWKRNAAGEVVYLNKDGTWLSQCTFGWFDTRVELDILLQKDSTQK